MSSHRRIVLLTSLLLASCARPEAPAPRAELRAQGTGWSVVPAAGQLPFCLVIEERAGGVRTLPLADDGESVPCEPGKAIGERVWPLPQRDDAFEVFVVFSDRKLKADSIALQIGERLASDPKALVSSMDLRAPGQAALEMLTVRPAELRKGPAAPR